jgi:WD40 repeat protein/tRNA A-37 threonylcarbamoyl transferase component Bud32
MPAIPPDPPDDAPAAEPAVTRAAAFDDYLAGFASAATDDNSSALHGDEPASAKVAGLLDTILMLRQAAAADGVTPTLPQPNMPARIGRHTILRLAGDGGFATVWEGFDTLLRRPVAVKVRRPEMLLSDAARRRFVREAEIAARLVHPHIVTIFEVGEDQGREFIAAEFCSGGSLAGWLEWHPGPLPPRDAARLVQALANAVTAAHAAGVVHRDIKPANVLLVPAPSGSESILATAQLAGGTGQGFTIKLGDFGLGKLHDESDGSDQLTQLTRTGTSIGTPAWMAPEQLDRSFGPIGPATDVHALGLLLYRLLTGRTLRGGRTDAETYRQVLLDEPLPADAVERSVPRDLAAVAVKCLAKQPQDRYASASGLADDLERWLDGRPTLARPLSPAGRGIRWIRRRPVVAGLAAAAVVATLSAGWVGIERMREARVAARLESEIRQQQAVAELRRGCEALRAGNVAGAIAQLEATRGLDAELADSFAGRWLLRRTHGERSILLAPEAVAPGAAPRPRDLYAITVSPDGRMAAVAGADGGVRLLRGLGGSPAVTTVAAHDEVNEVGFSADGTRLVTAGQDGRLRWWTITDDGLEPKGEAFPAAGPLYAAAFTPDGTSIAIGGEDRIVRIVNLASPDDPRTLFQFEQPPGKSPEVESIVFVDDTTLAASCGDLVVLLDAATGRLIRELRRPMIFNRNAVLGSLTVSADGRQLMACGTDAQAHVWEIATGRVGVVLPTHPAWVQGCCFLPDGERVATACRDGSIRVFDIHTGDMLTRLVGHMGRVWSVTSEPAGTLLTCGADGTVRRWDPSLTLDTSALREFVLDGDEILRIQEGPLPDAEPPTAGASPAERPVMVIDRAGGVSSIDVTSGSACRLAHPQNFNAVELSVDAPRRRMAVSWLRADHMSAFNLPATLSEAANGHANALPANDTQLPLPATIDPREAVCCWTRSGELLVCSRLGRLCLVAANLAETRLLKSPLEDPVHELTLAPAGPPRVAAAGKHTAILSLASGPGQVAPAPLVFPIGEESSAVAWSPDGGLLACGTRTGRTLLFSTATGAPRGGLVPHQRHIVFVAFSADGRTLVTADNDCVRISDIGTLTTLDEIRPGWSVRAARLAANGSRLVLGGSAVNADGTNSARLAVLEIAPP